MKQYDRPNCCKDGDLWICWEKFDLNKKCDGEGPERDGWSMMVGNYCCVNVTYCPFCGKKLG